MTRRTVLTGAAALLAAGITAAPGRAGASGAAPSIRSAAARGGELLALTADGEAAEPYAIRRFTVEDDGCVSLGERLPVDLPAGFHPHSMAARGEALWVTGAVDELVKTVTVDNRSDPLSEFGASTDPGEADPALPDGVVDIDVYRARPALLRLQGDRSAFAELSVPAQIRSGAATAVALPGRRGLAVAIEGCPDADLAMITRSHLAFSADDGRTWRHVPLAEGLGEGYGTVLAATGDRLVAVTADGTGTQTMRSGSILRSGLELVATEDGAGRPMAAVPTADGEVSVFSDRDGKVSESRFGHSGRVNESPGTECGCAGEVVAIRGRTGAWLELDADTVRARGL
ncbi:hypothetical protein [Glycomyces arizonensis]|uniref:hypothetical protein n=1 Tax=Glycomyces arizonensis TaxID=256035 RepID=UPI00047C35CA|nr:hypothetical protein [Glycomyces arizonensis]